MTTYAAPQSSTALDIAAAFEFAGLTAQPNRWGQMQARLDEDRLVRVVEDDTVITVLLLTGGRAELNAGEAHLSGRLANPTTIAAVIEALSE